MANPVWPNTLPQYVERSGYAEKPGDNTIETPVDAGPAKVRRRFTADVRRFTVALKMSAAQCDTFEAFWRDDLLQGALPFDWVHPRTRAATTYLFRKPHWSLGVASGGGFVVVTLNLEKQS